MDQECTFYNIRHLNANSHNSPDNDILHIQFWNPAERFVLSGKVLCFQTESTAVYPSGSLPEIPHKDSE
jgi:hypothetical protein